MQDLTALVRSALEEDIGPGDATTAATVDPDLGARGLITQRGPGVIYGLRAAELAFTLLDRQARAEYLTAEGSWREQGGPVMRVEGLARALLTAERTALNFLSHLSGVATMAARAEVGVDGGGGGGVTGTDVLLQRAPHQRGEILHPYRPDPAAPSK